MKNKNQNKSSNDLRYGLDDTMKPAEMLIYASQHVIYFLAGTIILPLIVANYLGLDRIESSEMLLRTFFLCGIASIIQARFGHRYPIIDGPSGMWAAMLISMAGAVAAKSAAVGGGNLPAELSVLRTNMEMGMMISGVFIAILGIFGLMPYIAKLFTPLVNGVYLTLMVLQLSNPVIAGMFGNAGKGQNAPLGIDIKTLIVFLTTVLIVLVITIKAKGFFQSIATLIGVMAGWVISIIVGVNVADANIQTSYSFFQIPQVFAWGRPTFDPVIGLTCIIGSFLLFANVLSSIKGTADAVGEKASSKQIKRGTLGYAFSSLLSGIFPQVGFTTFATSMGVISLTKVASRRPFYIASAVMILLGLIKPVGLFFASMPTAVSYAAMLTVFSMILGQGMRELASQTFGVRESIIAGVPMIIGTGIMFQPIEVFSSLPNIAANFISNGLLVGTLMTIILELILGRK